MIVFLVVLFSCYCANFVALKQFRTSPNVQNKKKLKKMNKIKNKLMKQTTTLLLYV